MGELRPVLAGHVAYRLDVLINISLKEQSKKSLAEFERRIAALDEVMEWY